MTLNLVLCAAAALLVLGLGAIALRRSLIGVVIGAQLCCGALLLFAAGLFGLSGVEPSTGQVVAVALVAFAAAASMLAIALHLAAARANRKAEDLEPW